MKDNSINIDSEFGTKGTLYKWCISETVYDEALRLRVNNEDIPKLLRELAENIESATKQVEKEL